MSRTVQVLAIGLLLLRTQMSAQVAYFWSFQELADKSDVVVVATPVATRDTGIKTEINELRPPLPVVELSTEFKISSVLKGTIGGSTFSLRHYRLDTDRIKGGCLNCGGRLDFTANSPTTKRCRAGDVSPQLPTCEYILFLKIDRGGVFIPTSGQVFPGNAVFLLQRAD